MNIAGKACVRCGEFYATLAEGFHRQSNGPNGFKSRCKRCIRETATRPLTVERECAGCGKHFAANVYLIRYARKMGRAAEVCCSPECRTLYRRNPESRVTLACVRCGQRFDTWRSAAARHRKFCSPECAGIKAAPVAVTCETCREQFYLTPARAAIRRFCSQECAVVNRTASNAPPQVARLHRKAWQRTRAKVLARDKSRCVRCGRGGGGLHIHHIIPWQDSRDDSLPNLETLCVSCHLAVEVQTNSRYRYRNRMRAVAC